MSEILFKAFFPVIKHGILKNSKQILFNKSKQQHFIGKSKDADLCEKHLIMKLNIERIKQKLDTIETDIQVKLIFYFPKTIYYTKKNERSLKLPDIDNLFGTVFDCLQKAQIIKNDTQICSVDGTRRLPIDKTDYYLDIEIINFF